MLLDETNVMPDDTLCWRQQVLDVMLFKISCKNSSHAATVLGRRSMDDAPSELTDVGVGE